MIIEMEEVIQRPKCLCVIIIIIYIPLGGQFSKFTFHMGFQFPVNSMLGENYNSVQPNNGTKVNVELHGSGSTIPNYQTLY